MPDMTQDPAFDAAIKNTFDRGGLEALKMVEELHRWWRPWRKDIQRTRRAILDSSLTHRKNYYLNVIAKQKLSKDD